MPYLRLTTIACALALGLAAGTASAAPPAFWHYYYNLPRDMEYCGRLIKEAVTVTNANWDFDGGDVDANKAAFTKGNTRGFLRCLPRSADRSWVVIITSGGGSQARKIYDDLKVVICGNC